MKNLKTILIIISIAILLSSCNNGGCNKTFKDELISLNLDGKTSGSFFLGTGTIDNDFYYFYYAKDKDGFITFNKRYATSYNTRISYIDTSATIKPYVENCVNLAERIVTFYIPRNTIKSEYNLNLDLGK